MPGTPRIRGLGYKLSIKMTQRHAVLDDPERQEKVQVCPSPGTADAWTTRYAALEIAFVEPRILKQRSQKNSPAAKTHVVSIEQYFSVVDYGTCKPLQVRYLGARHTFNESTYQPPVSQP